MTQSLEPDNALRMSDGSLCRSEDIERNREWVTSILQKHHIIGVVGTLGLDIEGDFALLLESESESSLRRAYGSFLSVPNVESLSAPHPMNDDRDFWQASIKIKEAGG